MELEAALSEVREPWSRNRTDIHTSKNKGNPFFYKQAVFSHTHTHTNTPIAVAF